MNTTIGTCSICGGPVQVPSVWMGLTPPVPTCSRCGARATESYGPIIPMTPIYPVYGSSPMQLDSMMDSMIMDKHAKMLEDWGNAMKAKYGLGSPEKKNPSPDKG